jgi:hypothetical protein
VTRLREVGDIRGHSVTAIMILDYTRYIHITIGITPMHVLLT